MARILVSDTEAFAPTYKSTYVPLEELPKDKQLRRLSAEIGLAEKAIPLADLVARGGSTLYGGIHDWWEEHKQEQKAEEAKLRGGKQLPPEDFSGAEAKAGPTVTQAATKPETTPQKETYEERQKRIGGMGLKDWLDKDEMETAISDAQRIAMERRAQMEAAKQAEETVQRHGNVLESIRLQNELSEAKKREHELEHARLQAVQEDRHWDLPEFNQKLGEAGTAVADAQKRLAAFNAPSSIHLGAGARVFHDPRTGEIRSIEPGYPTLGRGSLAYELEASRERPFQVGGKPVAAPSASAAEAPAREGVRLPARTYTQERGGIPAGAMTAAPADITRKVNDPGRTGQVSYPTAPPRSTAAELVAEKKAEVEAATKKPVAPEKPSAPKTIGQATDSQLDVIQRKLQAAAQANPSDAGIAERLKDVTDELEYRATKDMPRTYEQWSALARMADTPEKQARVLEMTKNVHMPVAGLADLLTPSSQLAERQAMGTSTERGLFPAMAKQASELDLAKAAKAWSQSRQLDLRNPYDLALLQAHIEESKAKSGLTDAKTSDIIAMIPSKVEAMEELGHQRHEMAGYYSAKAKAEDARSRLRGMGGGRGNIKNLEFIARELGDRRKEEVGEAKAAAESAKRDAIANEAYYRQAADRYEMAAAAVPTEPPEDPGPFARESIKAQYRRDKQAYDQKVNEAKTAASIRDQAKAKLDEANGIVRQREQLVVDSITAGQQDRNTVDALHREIAGPGGAKLLPPAKPPATQPTAAPTTAPASGLPKGVKLTGETKVGTPKGGTEKMVWGKGSDGKWYPIRKAP